MASSTPPLPRRVGLLLDNITSTSTPTSTSIDSSLAQLESWLHNTQSLSTKTIIIEALHSIGSHNTTYKQLILQMLVRPEILGFDDENYKFILYKTIDDMLDHTYNIHWRILKQSIQFDLSHSSPKLRAQAIQVLHTIAMCTAKSINSHVIQLEGKMSYLQVLWTFLDDWSDIVRQKCMSCITRDKIYLEEFIRRYVFRSKASQNRILSLFNDESPLVRQQAISMHADLILFSASILRELQSRAKETHGLKLTKDFGKWVDEIFTRCCDLVNDADINVRVAAVEGLGKFPKYAVSIQVLKQTFSKSELIRPALQKQSSSSSPNTQLEITDGEFEILMDSNTNIMEAAACGAFVHALEDEYKQVRLAAIQSIETIVVLHCKKQPQLTGMGITALMDMFNDKMPEIRLAAIDAIRKIAFTTGFDLKLEETKTAITVLIDTKQPVRHGAWKMFSALKFTDKNCVKIVLRAVYLAIERFPLDKEGLFAMLKSMAMRIEVVDDEMVAELLSLDRRFLAQEKDVDSLDHIIIMIFIFGTNYDLTKLPKYTFRQYLYLKDKYPMAFKEITIPDSETTDILERPLPRKPSTDDTTTPLNILKSLLAPIFNLTTTSTTTTHILTTIHDLKTLSTRYKTITDPCRFFATLLDLAFISLPTLFPLNDSSTTSGVLLTPQWRTQYAKLLSIGLDLEHNYTSSNSSIQPMFISRVLPKLTNGLLLLGFLKRFGNDGLMTRSSMDLDEDMDSANEIIDESNWVRDVVGRLKGVNEAVVVRDLEEFLKLLTGREITISTTPIPTIPTLLQQNNIAITDLFRTTTSIFTSLSDSDLSPPLVRTTVSLNLSPPFNTATTIEFMSGVPQKIPLEAVITSFVGPPTDLVIRIRFPDGFNKSLYHTPSPKEYIITTDKIILKTTIPLLELASSGPYTIILDVCRIVKVSVLQEFVLSFDEVGEGRVFKRRGGDVDGNRVVPVPVSDEKVECRIWPKWKLGN